MSSSALRGVPAPFFSRPNGPAQRRSAKAVAGALQLGGAQPPAPGCRQRLQRLQDSLARTAYLRSCLRWRQPGGQGPVLQRGGRLVALQGPVARPNVRHGSKICMGSRMAPGMRSWMHAAACTPQPCRTAVPILNRTESRAAATHTHHLHNLLVPFYNAICVLLHPISRSRREHAQRWSRAATRAALRRSIFGQPRRRLAAQQPPQYLTA